MASISCKFCLEKIAANEWAVHIAEKGHRDRLPSKLVLKGSFESSRIAEVDEYFSRFGKITEREIVESDDFVNLIQYSYEDPMTYSTVVHSEHNLWGEKLDISWCRSSCLEEIQKIDDVSNEFRRVHAVGHQDADFSQQVSNLLAHFPCNSPELRALRETTLGDFVKAVRTIVPKTKIHFYGSAVTGLQLPEGSPVDVYLEGQPSIEAFNLKLLQEREFQTILRIAAQEKQMVKFKCLRTGIILRAFIGIQVEFKTDVLIQYYLSLDEKIRKLMLVLKYWLRCQSKTQNFTSCVLYMLVIFYLQQEPYKLPTVVDLQRGATPEIYRNWNYALAPIQVSIESLQSATLLELVEGFFRFYENFDHVSYVLSPYAGYAIAKIDFLPPYNLPSFYRSFVDMNAVLDVGPDMCLQDPFDHSQNLTKCCGAFWGSQFASLCRRALPLMREKNALFSICCGRNHPKPLPEMVKLFKKSRKETIRPSSTQTLTQNFTLLKPEGYDSDDEFGACVEEVFQYTLTNVLHCGPTLSSKDDEPVYEYGSTVWEDRDKVLKKLVESLPGNATELEKEVAISEYILPTTGTASCTVGISWRLEANPVGAKFTVTGKNDMKEASLMHLTHYLRVKMGKFLQDMRIDQVNVEEDLEVANCVGRLRPLFPQASDAVPVQDPKSDNPNSLDASEEKENANPTTLIRVHPGEKGDSKPANRNLVNTIIHSREEDVVDLENIPDNFFDDFANEDFLDGLELGTDDKLNPENNTTNSSERRGSRPPNGRIRDRSRSRGISGSSKSSKPRGRSRSPDRSTRRVGRYRSKSRDRSSVRNRKKGKSSDPPRTRSRSKSRQRRRSRFSSPGRTVNKNVNKSLLEEVLDKINRVCPVSQNLCTQANYSKVPADDPIHKQLAQKKISLADYVTILGKRQGTPVLTPEQLQMKTKVLDRCEDFLQPESYDEPLRVRPSRQPKAEPHVTPIQRCKVKFKFTSPAKDSEDGFLSLLYATLKRIGIFGEMYDNERLVDSVAEALSSGTDLDPNLAAQVLQVSLMGHCARGKRVAVDEV